MSEHERHAFDVVVIGAGGAGLRAAIAAHERGLRTAIICKSLFGKAHTVMAEGGIAAAMGNVNNKDNWQVHFRDTMRGGKFLNSWRMAELHAKEAPERVWELETYGALFDRTKEGKISQRNFGGHEYPRLAHVGDRTGLELIRTLQQKIVSLQQDDDKRYGSADGQLEVFAEVTVTKILKDDSGAVTGVFGYRREDGSFLSFDAPAVVLATGGIGKSFTVTSNSWEYTGDGHALAHAGRRHLGQHGVHPVPPHRHGLAPEREGHPRHGVGPRRRRRPDQLRGQALHVRLRSRRLSGEVRQRPRKKPTAGTPTPTTTCARRSCCRATRSPAPSTPRSRPVVARPRAASTSTSPSGCPLTSSARSSRRCGTSSRSSPTSTSPKKPMQVGPTCHYVMGGLEVDPDTEATRVPGLFAAGEVAGGMHGSNRLGGNSLSDLLVFGRRAGVGAADYVDGLGEDRSGVTDDQLAAAEAEALAPFNDNGDENPYTVHSELQQMMNSLVGIIRREDEVAEALTKLEGLKERAARVTVSGGRAFNPGWHLALDLDNMLVVSECVARAALERQESRGGHTRDDYPGMNPEWRKLNLICELDDGNVSIRKQPLPPMREDLLALFEVSELSKYLTEAELPVPAAGGSSETGEAR